MAISPDTGSSPGQLNFYQQVNLSRYFPFNIPRSLCCYRHRSTNASANYLFNFSSPTLRSDLLSLTTLSLDNSCLNAGLNNFTLVAQNCFPQPTLFSTTSFRNHSSHKLCSTPSSTNASLNHFLSKPFLAQALLNAFLNQRFSNQRPNAEAPTPQR